MLLRQQLKQMNTTSDLGMGGEGERWGPAFKQGKHAHLLVKLTVLYGTCTASNNHSRNIVDDWSWLL